MSHARKAVEVLSRFFMTFVIRHHSIILAKKKITIFPLTKSRFMPRYLSSFQQKLPILLYGMVEIWNLLSMLLVSANSHLAKNCAYSEFAPVSNTFTFQGLGNHFKKRRIYVSLTFRYSFWCKLLILR